MKELVLLRPEARGFVPNNPALPVILYRGAFEPKSADLAAEMETRFEANGWPPQWRNGIYDFHHYHATGHEVLGIAAGSVDLVIGGEGGETIAAKAGDVLLLPVGTGHCRASASSDLLVVGAYPPGQGGEIMREAATAALLRDMRHLAIPRLDPVQGDGGPLAQHWSTRLSG
ncbi:cupin [Bosea sp. PAMC 26642]|uniref:cupin n=1 Tax=Bosea sp. (strain PAMC 26642) TaxID=1792307 RepID=UPI00077058B8|nr:cupin [Bosea sp. PAMC 26642]AMJ63926.1 cupin [Bosea sp. PAMC 26642]